MAKSESTAALLALLADGDFHSGEALGEKLGISRAAIWKQLKALQAIGVQFESQQGVGYRIENGLDLLCRSEISAGLSPEASKAIQQLDLELSVDSTNNRVADLASTLDVGRSFACLSETQTAGRGRRGRRWSSGFAQGLCLSLAWKFQNGAASLGGLSLAVGLALSDVLSAHGAKPIDLKWPNDVLYKGRKLAGILVELRGDATDECTVVIGLGLNINLQPTKEIEQPWVNLSEIVPLSDINRSRLAADLLSRLIEMLIHFGEKGFAAFRDSWLERAAYMNQVVKITRGQSELQGRFVGVDNSGALCLDREGEIQVFNGGEISLRSGL